MTPQQLADEVLRLDEKCKSSVKNGDIAGHMRIAGEFRCHAPILARMVRCLVKTLEDIKNLDLKRCAPIKAELALTECQRILEKQ